MQDDEQEEEEETSPDNEATGFLNSSVNRSNISINRSGHSCIQYTGVDVAVQTEYISYCPKLHINKRGCTNEIKSAFARSPPVCCVLIENYIKAVQITCKDLYNHNFYLSSNEQIMAEGVQPQPCDNHLYILLSVRAITNYKQLQASEMEREAAYSFFNKNKNSKAIIHFKTTGRSYIDGEPSPLILINFPDELQY